MAANPTTVATTPTTPALPVNWTIGFLKSIGAPVTQNNIDNVLRWGNAESGGTQKFGGWNNFNPLNIVTQSGDNSTGAGGTQGDIANFGDISSGVSASARLFQGNPNASPIISTLRANGSTDQLNSAVNQFYSSWSGSINLTGASSTPQTVTTTNAVGDALSNLPFVGGVFSAAGSTGALAGQFLGLFTNWRYVVEVFGGIALVVLGIFLIARDTGAYAKAKHSAGQAAVAGAA